jgi:hypothetical protein
MDGTTFDRLTRIVGGSRREALRTAVGGAAVAAAGVAASAIGTEAKKNKKRKRCKKRTWQGKAPGAGCTSNKDCCTNETNLACSVRNAGVIANVCCGALGAGCDADNDCCHGFRCDTGAGECEADAP